MLSTEKSRALNTKNKGAPIRNWIGATRAKDLHLVYYNGRKHGCA